ncbi:GATA transcription factor 26-like [Olea europaea subsp. europaea]|uniref:GATA transcription factor 26-like n=1 Tax=Olea europaea subsp. europaea TaxID=158383 RepID=A0A8S0R744_OLEEU|nr:GATA transcription factor 26-like [Olea europaea subsp. europaea]
MGKQGPCYHCGVTSTPLWRNGPPEKPVLCNACGSRWRTKGTLANYFPLHARSEPNGFEDYKVLKVKNISMNDRANILKRKKENHTSEYGGVPSDHSLGFCKGFDEDTSNRSSSGSAISNSENCARYSTADAGDLTGASQPVVWDTMVPSRKRTCISRSKPSPVEKLTKDLYTILHEQQSSCFSGSSEEDLLLESDKPMVSVEIGHGSVLIRHPSSIAKEEESEASSLSIDNKPQPTNEAYSWSMTPPVHSDDKLVNYPSREIEKVNKLAGQGMGKELIKRDENQLEKLQLLANHNSPLHHTDLRDILNFDKFVAHLTNDEQKQLLKILPSIDTTAAPESLRSMFSSPQFKENVSSFQKLLAEGVFDNSFSGVKVDHHRTLKKLVLYNLTKSKWVEQYNLLKGGKGKDSISKSEGRGLVARLENVQRSQDGQHQKFIGARTMMKSPRRVLMKSIYDHKDLIDNDGPENLFSLPNDNGSRGLDTLQFADENSEQDLLLDVPYNSSFPQAELLPPSNFAMQASTSSNSVYPHLARP